MIPPETRRSVDRFLTGAGVTPRINDFVVDPNRQRASVLCYLEGPEGLLLLRRNKEPFAGFWTAPGGKIELGEDPVDAIRREIREETALEIIEPRLQVITSEIGGPDYDWLLLIFRCHSFRGELGPCDEGELRWVPRDQLPRLKIPSVDARLLPCIFDDSGPFLAFIEYNQAHDVAGLDVSHLSMQHSR